MVDPFHPRSWLAILVALAGIAPALADDAPPPDKSAYSVFNPTPDAIQRSLSTDRPTKAVSPITVDAGHFLIESDFANYSFGTYAGVTSYQFVAADPVIKLGLTNSVQFEMLFGGFQTYRAIDTGSHLSIGKSSGLGDTSFRLKVNLVGNEGGPYAIGLAPIVKIPSSTPFLSNGYVEGGLQVPFLINLPNDFSIIGTPEIDILKDGVGPNDRPAYRTATALFHAIPGIKDLTGSIEFASFNSTDKFHPDTYTVDLGLAYLIDPTLQLDVGTYIGLNEAAPALQIFAGISKRF